MKKFFFSGIVASLVLAGAGCVASPSNTPSNTNGQGSNEEVSVPSGWAVFGDGHDAFTIAHPSDTTTPEVQDPYHYLPDVRASFFLDNASYHPMNYSQDGTVMVSSSANTDACYDPVQTGEDKAFDGTTTINGSTFKMVTFSGAGAGNRYDTTVYRTIHADTCFEIATTLHSASDWTDVDQSAIDRSQKEMNDTMKQMVETFQFTD